MVHCCLITGSPGEKKALTYAICQFPWCKYFYQGDAIENGVGKVYEQSHSPYKLTEAEHYTLVSFSKLAFISNLGDILASSCLRWSLIAQLV